MWQFRPSPDRWTIHEIIIHIADSEANSYIRCRRFIAEPGSIVLGYDEMKWARDLDYHTQCIDDALELFKWLRHKSYILIKTLPESVWSNTVNHTQDAQSRWMIGSIRTSGIFLNILNRCKPILTIGRKDELIEQRQVSFSIP